MAETGAVETKVPGPKNASVVRNAFELRTQVNVCSVFIHFPHPVHSPALTPYHDLPPDTVRPSVHQTANKNQADLAYFLSRQRLTSGSSTILYTMGKDGGEVYGPELVPKWRSKWMENGCKIAPKWTQNGSRNGRVRVRNEIKSSKRRHPFYRIHCNVGANGRYGREIESIMETPEWTQMDPSAISVGPRPIALPAPRAALSRGHSPPRDPDPRHEDQVQKIQVPNAQRPTFSSLATQNGLAFELRLAEIVQQFRRGPECVSGVKHAVVNGERVAVVVEVDALLLEDWPRIRANLRRRCGNLPYALGGFRSTKLRKYRC
ncbi:hypothetical protein BDK51DRAFT_36982 [Blyttiomyces helicus]|uniref:Uncharacterized protein n=1 Tax=Blyttiomyces helicus TaxID=388810 RepID=A0A4P9WNQ2_9FUNG|nr:hypothetical protein BDK51DRAFT_36982 [Blyttiomyces helicus]|eukprot:RKO94759.1 hypothetical protein BDK51DRAFT_36982 [Blyttiomyces helicus]